MWAYSLVAPERFAKVDAPQPDPAHLTEGEVLLRTLAGGICGSDLPAFKGYPALIPAYDGDYPGYPMHEVVGEVVASRCDALTPGDRVVGWAHGMNAIAEYVVTGGTGVARYDTALDPAIAVMLQPLACVLYAIDQLGPIEGERVAVLGLGPMGVLFSHVASHRGAAHVTGVDRVARDDVAEVFCVDEAVHGSAERWGSLLTDDVRPTVIIEAIGHQASTLEVAVDALAMSGRLYYFGVPDTHPYAIDMWKFLRKHLHMQAGTTLSQARYIEKAGEYLAANPVLADRYVTHTYDVADVQEAYTVANRPAEGRLKVSLRM